jgi:hypothetical protein
MQNGQGSKLLLTVAIPTITVLIGILINNRQLDQVQRHVHQQIVSLRNELTASLQRVEGVLDARLKLVEEILKIR